MECELLEECRNKDNVLKCGKCENNPANWQKMEQDEKTKIKKQNPKIFYIFRDNYDPL